MRVKVKRSLTPWTKKRKALVQDALKWGIAYLGDTEGVRLNVILTGECSDTLGDAYYDDVSTCTIRLNDHSKESRNRVLRTLFHEMWHIRQYLHEGLSVEAGGAEFKGKTWKRDRGTDEVAGNLYKVAFAKDDVGFILGNDGILLRYRGSA